MRMIECVSVWSLRRQLVLHSGSVQLKGSNKSSGSFNIGSILLFSDLNMNLLSGHHESEFKSKYGHYFVRHDGIAPPVEWLTPCLPGKVIQFTQTLIYQGTWLPSSEVMLFSKHYDQLTLTTSMRKNQTFGPKYSPAMAASWQRYPDRDTLIQIPWQRYPDIGTLTEISWQKYPDRGTLTQIPWQRYPDTDILTEIPWQRHPDRYTLTETSW